MTIAARKRAKLILERVPVDSGWDAYRLDIKNFPLTAEGRHHLFLLVEELTAGIREVFRAAPTLWIDSQPLHHDGGSKVYSANARAWSPEMGFCFDPAGESPRPLQMSDLMDVDYGTPPKIFERSAIHVSALAQSMPAYRLLAGRGISTLLYFAGEGPDDPRLLQAVEGFMQHSRDELRSSMARGHFQNFPFYLPLLSSKSIAGVAGEQLGIWIRGAEVYLHESFDAQEVLILSREDLRPVFQPAHLRPEEIGEKGARWTFSVPPEKESDHA